VSGFQEFLRGDASDVETGAADQPLLDEAHIEADTGPVERSGIATGAAADHDHIMLSVDRKHLL